MAAFSGFRMHRYVCRHASCFRGSLFDSISNRAPVSLRDLVRHQSQSQAQQTPESGLPPPPPAGFSKEYPIKIKKLVDDISALNLIEVSDLNELLKKTLRIPDQPMFAGGFAAAPQAAAPDEEVAKKKEKVNFTIILRKFDETKKVVLIKEIKTLIEGMNLVQAKKYVESLPQTVRVDISKEEAEKLKAQLEAVGGVVDME